MTTETTEWQDVAEGVEWVVDAAEKEEGVPGQPPMELRQPGLQTSARPGLSLADFTITLSLSL